MTAQGVNALGIYLGNFRPAGPTTICAQAMGLPRQTLFASHHVRSSSS
jgi:hypothetical protein